MVNPDVYYPHWPSNYPCSSKLIPKFANFLVLYWPVVISLLHNFMLLVMCVFKNFCGLCFARLNLALHGTIDLFIFRGSVKGFNPLNPELNLICYLLALLGAHHFLHVSRIRVKSLNLRVLISYIHIYIYIEREREHLFLMFLDHTQRRSTVGRTPLDE